MSDCFETFFAFIFFCAHEEVARFRGAAGDAEEVVEVEDAAFAAGPAFAAFVEDGGAGVVLAVFIVAASVALVGFAAGLAVGG